MAYQGPRLRGGWNSPTPYPLGQIPDSVIRSIASNIVYSSAVGRKDISGDDWGDIFAAAVNGNHRKSPLGLADIVLESTAWSAKTVQSKNASASSVRLISGRNSPIFSSGNQDFFADVQETGKQVLEIWNSRVEQATQEFPHLRTVVLIRDMAAFRFKIFEFQTVLFVPSDFQWSLNENDNFIGRSVLGNVHTFTWQPHGSQFTIHRPVGGSARSFRVKKPDTMEAQEFLDNLGFDDSWVTFL